MENEEKIICGIYKITSPSGRIYIGESKSIYDRWRNYKNLACISQRKLYYSIKKYGMDSHIFEIIEECEFEELLCRERYWQDFYDVLNGGLNLKLTECGDKKGIHSEETKEKMKLRWKLHGLRGSAHPLYGKKLSLETVDKMKNAFYKREQHPRDKLVLSTQTGIFYKNVKEAAIAYSIKHTTLLAMLNGVNKNKTDLILC